MKILFLDAYNLIYRARSGFTGGDYPVVYNFFRSIRPIIETFDPDKVYFVLEGVPQFRKNLSEGSYKGNRKSAGDDFHRQKTAIINLVSALMPFETIRHPNLECDDAIATMSTIHANKGDSVTIVSSDSDFIQLLNLENVDIKLYNPIRKKFIKAPDYDYVTWKALRGDATDNIAGIPGVGDKTATKIIKSPSKMKALLENKEKREIFERNVNLIRLVNFENNISELERNTGTGDFEMLYGAFEDLGFDSMLKEKTWNKFIKTFGRLIQNVLK
jgi:DNA polymerase I